jgi:hypothetical protein
LRLASSHSLHLLRIPLGALLACRGCSCPCHPSTRGALR